MHAHPWLVAHTRRISPGSGLNVVPAMPCARPERPAWSEPSPQARNSTSNLSARVALLLLDGTRAVPVAAGLALDLDLAPLQFLGLRNSKHQHTVVEPRVDVLGVDALGKGDAELEAPHPARAPADFPSRCLTSPVTDSSLPSSSMSMSSRLMPGSSASMT